MLKVEGLVKRFGGIRALNACAFDVPKGKITGLIGPNGAGKTTLFNLITGYLKPDGGAVYFNGERIDGLTPHMISWKGITRTFQYPRVFERMTVMENLVVPVQNAKDFNIFGGIKEGHFQKAEGLLRQTNLEEYQHALAGILSFGQKKLLLMAAALMTDPQILLLDEPIEGIHPHMIDRLKKILRALNRKGLTLLIIEHNMPVIMDLCEWVIVLHHGEKIAEGTPEEIQNNREVLEVYLEG